MEKEPQMQEKKQKKMRTDIQESKRELGLQQQKAWRTNKGRINDRRVLEKNKQTH